MSESPLPPTGVNPFADSVNPYAAPRAEGYLPPQNDASTPYAGLWRQGKLLVMHKDAPLPAICPKSNEPATRKIRRHFQWHHPAITLTILLGLLVYIVLAVVLTKRADIDLPLSEEWYLRRKRRFQFAWFAGILGILLVVGGFLLAIEPGQAEWAWLLVMGILVAVGALIYGQYATALLRPTRMTDQYVWLKGAHPDFLNRLDAWQWNV